MAYGPSVKHLVDRIRKAGFARAFLDSAIPTWWEPAAEDEPGAIDHLKLILARRFGLKIRPLLEADQVIFSVPGSIRFKRSANVAETAPSEPLIAYLNAVSNDVAAAMPDRSREPNQDPSELRKSLLAFTNAKWISLNALLMYCWQHLGIAVIGLRSDPSDQKRFDAVTFRTNDRYVIFIAKDVQYHAWASFILAHEIGHIALRHIAEGEVLLEDPLIGEGVVRDAQDEEEVAASRYALALLGDKDLVAVIGKESGSPGSLAVAALAAGRAEGIDPGHLILRYAYGSGNWATAQIALRLLHKAPDALDFVNARAGDMLVLDNLGTEARETIESAITQG